MNGPSDEELARRVVEIPRRLAVGDISILSLLREIGFPARAELPSASNLRAALTHDRDLIEEWVQYSEDKRVPSGWFVQRLLAGRLRVGRLGTGGGIEAAVTWQDETEAVAEFIRRELSEIIE